MKQSFGLFLAPALLAAALFPTFTFADDCSEWSRFATQEDYLAPQSVDVRDIGKFLSSYEYSEGIQFSSDIRGPELWIDITKYPGTTTAAGASRAIMQIGRLAKDDFDYLVLADGSVGLFGIPEPKLRDIGCQFIWGREGGQNPIALMRELFRALERYDDRQPLSRQFNGSLLRDTSLAMELNNTLLVPEWVMSAVD